MHSIDAYTVHTLAVLSVLIIQVTIGATYDGCRFAYYAIDAEIMKGE